jgi:PST family polysaccharide transporter
MTLIKTSFLSAIATLIKIIAGFIINKVVAMYVGPSGLAIIGQFQNFISIVSTFANGAITQGIVKYTAEYRNNIDIKSKLFSTALLITLFSSGMSSFFLIIFSSYFSSTILHSNNYDDVFILFGFTIVLFALNTMLLSILNGQKEIKTFITINILSSLTSLLFTSLLIINLGLKGALYALVSNQSIIFFVTLFFVVKSNWFKMQYFRKGIDKQIVSNLTSYSLMAIASVVTLPVSHLLIRSYIGEELSWDAAGHWQAMTYISSMYLMVITTSLSIYYLPRLSEIDNNIELKEEIINGYKTILPIVSFLAIFIFLLKEYIVIIAFTEKFQPMVVLFKWQLMGDVVQIAGWLLGYVMIAKSMTKAYIFIQFFVSTSFVLLSYLFINLYGLVGVSIAHFVNYIICLVVMIWIFKDMFFRLEIESDVR